MQTLIKKRELPKDIKNQKYYNVEISGSALENCDVIDYSDVKIKRSGMNKIFIGDFHVTGILL